MSALARPARRLARRSVHRTGRAVLGAASALLVAFGTPASASAQSSEPVLGIAGLMGEYGTGWGTAKPTEFFNGGVPSGAGRNLTWTGWGSKTAQGVGEIALYLPEGGYYEEPGRLEVRASRLGRCPGAEGQLAYTRMIARTPEFPGGPMGDWFSWTLDLCDFEAKPRECRSVAFAKNSGSGAFEIKVFDSGCATARKLAKASKPVRIRFGGDDLKEYRFKKFGFVCNGYSFDSDDMPSISWTCNRSTTVVSFKRG